VTVIHDHAKSVEGEGRQEGQVAGTLLVPSTGQPVLVELVVEGDARDASLRAASVRVPPAPAAPPRRAALEGVDRAFSVMAGSSPRSLPPSAPGGRRVGSSAPSWDRATSFSMACSSSRTLPGQCQAASRCEDLRRSPAWAGAEALANRRGSAPRAGCPRVLRARARAVDDVKPQYRSSRRRARTKVGQRRGAWR